MATCASYIKSSIPPFLPSSAFPGMSPLFNPPPFGHLIGLPQHPPPPQKRGMGYANYESSA